MSNSVKVFQDIQGVILVTIGQVVARLPFAPIWSLLFFIMLLTLGLDSQFALMETVTTAILDGIPALRSYKVWVVLGVAVVGYAGGIIFTTNVSFKSNRHHVSSKDIEEI